MKYTAVIRTLGKAGVKYQALLDSLCAQTIQPEAIIVYLADGYPIPKETCGREHYVYVKKGMVAQRALNYDEVSSEYILFLDDDVYVAPDGVEKLFEELRLNNADVISPDVFDNASRGLKAELMMTISGRMRARRGIACGVIKSWQQEGIHIINLLKINRICLRQTPDHIFLCRKSDFLRIRFEDELWLDRTNYAIGDDQVMFYKMYLAGLKLLTVFGTGIKHLDAGENLGNKAKELKIVEGDYFFRKIFWHRFLHVPERNKFRRIWRKLCLCYFYGFGVLMAVVKGDKNGLSAKCEGMARANAFLKSKQYSELPLICKQV